MNADDPEHDAPPLGKRLRAARAWAGIKDRDKAGRLVGVVGETIGRWERGNTTPDGSMLDKYADALGVPRWFLHEGFERAEEEPSVAERVEWLENRYAVIEARIKEIVAREFEAALSRSTAARATGKGARGPDHGPEPQEGSHL